MIRAGDPDRASNPDGRGQQAEATAPARACPAPRPAGRSVGSLGRSLGRRVVRQRRRAAGAGRSPVPAQRDPVLSPVRQSPAGWVLLDGAARVDLDLDRAERADLDLDLGRADPLIELDVCAPWEPPEPPARTWNLRWVVRLAVLVMLLTTVAADSGRTTLAPLLELSGQVRQAVLDPAGLLYAQEGHRAGARLAAYRLPQGRRLWRQAVAGVRQEISTSHGVLVVTSYDSDGRAIGVRGLDGASGRELWTRPGMTAVGQSGDLTVVVEPLSTGSDAVIITKDLGPTADRTMAGVNVRTGQTAWSTVLPAGCTWTITDDGSTGLAPRRTGLSSLVVFGPGSAIQVRDLATGALDAESDLGRRPANRYLGVTRDQVLILWDAQGGASTFLAFDLAGGRSLWQREVVGNGFVLPCGQRVCLSTDASTTVLDAETGNVQRRLPAAINGFVSGDRLISLGSLQPSVTVTDLGTGSALRNLTGWANVGTFPDGRLIVTRPVATPRGGTRDETVVAALDPDRGRLRVLGTVTGWSRRAECEGTVSYLACTGGSRTGVWRIPSAG